MADIKKKLVDGAGLQAAMGIMADYADKGVRGAIGGYNQSFPLTAATKGNIYYHKGTNRYYICVDNYNGSSLTNPNSKFEELSVYTNRQRLDNLRIITNTGKLNDDAISVGVGQTFKLKTPINNGDLLAIVTGYTQDNTFVYSFSLCLNNTIIAVSYNGSVVLELVNSTTLKVLKKDNDIRHVYKYLIR